MVRWWLSENVISFFFFLSFFSVFLSLSGFMWCSGDWRCYSHYVYNNNSPSQIAWHFFFLFFSSFSNRLPICLFVAVHSYLGVNFRLSITTILFQSEIPISLSLLLSLSLFLFLFLFLSSWGLRILLFKSSMFYSQFHIHFGKDCELKNSTKCQKALRKLSVTAVCSRCFCQSHLDAEYGTKRLATRTGSTA